MSRYRIAGMALMLLLAGSRAGAAVYEVNGDGTIERIDAGAAAIAAPLPRAKGQAAGKAGAARAIAFRPMIVDAAARYDVSPALVDAIAHTESRYDPAAVSRAGAAGIMQLMPGTARQLGVDARDPAANIVGGAAYIRYLLNRFDGDIVCTIAAYNAGPAAVSKRKCIPDYRETLAYVGHVLDRLAAATNDTGAAPQ
ncbi:MAG: lytic transglycosylase domain-containing protein [Sandarakinorhabdus sp.]|nr:lytic transglycosylase domain-containing protein [Sandarakinorhabdus sp.]